MFNTTIPDSSSDEELEEAVFYQIDIICGVITILMVLLVLCSFSYARHKKSKVERESDLFLANRPTCDLFGSSWSVVFNFTSREEFLLCLIFVAETAYVFLSLLGLFDDLNLYNLQSDGNSSLTVFGRLALGLRFIEFQSTLAWTLHEQRGEPSTNILIRLIQQTATFCTGFAFIILSSFERIITIEINLAIILACNVIICSVAVFIDIQANTCNLYVCGCSGSSSSSSHGESESNTKSMTSSAGARQRPRGGSRSRKNSHSRKHSATLSATSTLRAPQYGGIDYINNSVINNSSDSGVMKLNDRLYNESGKHRWGIIFILFGICIESLAAFVFITRFLTNGKAPESIFYTEYYTVNRGLVFIYSLIIILITTRIRTPKWDVEKNHVSRQKSKEVESKLNAQYPRDPSEVNQIKHELTDAGDINKNNPSLVELGASFEIRYTDRNESNIVNCINNKDSSDDKTKTNIVNDSDSVMDETKEKEKKQQAKTETFRSQESETFSPTEKAIIKDYCHKAYQYKISSSHWDNITTTVVGSSKVGKTLFVRALWSGEEIHLRKETQDNDVNVIENLHNKLTKAYDEKENKEFEEEKQRKDKYTVSKDDNELEAIQKMIKYVLENTNKYALNLDNLLMYNRYNLIDYYPRWEKNLQTSFVFWDTIGDLRFTLNILDCMRKSHVVLLMYEIDLTDNEDEKNIYDDDDVDDDQDNDNINDNYDGSYYKKASDESIEWLQRFNDKLKHYFKDNNNRYIKDIKFPAALIGVVKNNLCNITDASMKELRNRHEKVKSKLSTSLDHMAILSDQIVTNICHEPVATSAMSTQTNETNTSTITSVPPGKIHVCTILETLLTIEKAYKEAAKSGIIESQTGNSTSSSGLCCFNEVNGNGENTNSDRLLKDKLPMTRIDKLLKNRLLLLRQDREPKFESDDEMDVNENRNGNMKKIQSDINSISDTVKKGRLVKGPISVRYKKFRRQHLHMLVRFCVCLLFGAIFPFMFVAQTCAFWIYSDKWGYSNDGLAALMYNYRFKWGYFPLDFCFALPWFVRPLHDPLDVSLRSVFEAGSGAAATQEKLNKNKKARRAKSKSQSSLINNSSSNNTSSLSDKNSSNNKNNNERKKHNNQHKDNSKEILAVKENMFSNTTVDWFWFQTRCQKIFRMILAFCSCLISSFVVYNAKYFFKYGSRAEYEEWNAVSNFESIGPLVLYAWFWTMVSAWYAGNTVMTNSNFHLLTNAKERQSMGLSFKNKADHNMTMFTNVDIFLRSYSFYRSRARLRQYRIGSDSRHGPKLVKFKFVKKNWFFALIASVFAILPLFVRWIQGKESPLGSDKEDEQFVRNTVYRAMIANFTFVFMIELIFESVVRSAFKEYKQLMTEITGLIEIPNHQKYDTADSDTDGDSDIDSDNGNESENEDDEKKKLLSGDFTDDPEIFTDNGGCDTAGRTGDNKYKYERATRTANGNGDEHVRLASIKSISAKSRKLSKSRSKRSRHGSNQIIRKSATSHYNSMDNDDDPFYSKLLVRRGVTWQQQVQRTTKKLQKTINYNVNNDDNAGGASSGGDDNEDGDYDSNTTSVFGDDVERDPTLLNILDEDLVDEFEQDRHKDGRGIFASAGLEFLCLDDPENLISWMEIRDYSYIVGRQLFGELEWFLFSIGFALVIQAGYVITALFVGSGLHGQTVFCNYVLFFLNLLWSFRIIMYGKRFDKLQQRQVKALINQSACIRAEIITSATFTGPPKWMKLKVGTWDRLYDLMHAFKQRQENVHELINERIRAQTRGSIASLTDSTYNNNNSNGRSSMYEKSIYGIYFEQSEKETVRELRAWQESFNQYLGLIELFTYHVELNKIHPKIFGMKLSGALLKAIVASGVGFVVGVIKVIFF